jgi:NAD+ diphosphatase
MDRDKPPHCNTFAGLSLILDRAAERRDDAPWIEAQTDAADVRYLLLDAAGEAFMQRDRAA